VLCNLSDLLERLEEVYGRPREMPRFEPMEELVSCIMSQQTTDAKSFPAFTRLRERYPEWEQVVAAGPEEVAQVIWKAGLANQKARSIVKCLQTIKAETDEYSLDHLRPMETRAALAWLMKLPGVGPKTASLVLSLCFGKGTVAVDTHVFRVSWRLGIIPEKLGEAKAHGALLDIVPEELAFRYHATLIQHGRLTCKAPLPLCADCVVTDLCAWFQSGGPEQKKSELHRSRGRKGGARRQRD
jgi:endonuclease III